MKQANDKLTISGSTSNSNHGNIMMIQIIFKTDSMIFNYSLSTQL